MKHKIYVIFIIVFNYYKTVKKKLKINIKFYYFQINIGSLHIFNLIIIELYPNST